MPSVIVLVLDLEALEDDDIVCIIDDRERYSCYATSSSSQQAARLPKHKLWYHEILLCDPHAKLPIGVVYMTTWEEDEALQNYLDENLAMGKVRRSRWATAAPIVFVHKQDGSLKLVIDYRARNRLTICNNYPLPRISRLLDSTRGGKWFTEWDLKNGFHLIRVAAGHEWKTAFRTKMGIFEYTVMPFVLTNARATFQETVDTIFKNDEACVWYMDDILIYGGGTEAEHQAYVEKILQQFVNYELAINLTKSEFQVHGTIFLGHINIGGQVEMDPPKLESMSKWPIPTNEKEVQAFLGLANYERRFIENFSAMARPLIDLSKDVPFSCGH